MVVLEVKDTNSLYYRKITEIPTPMKVGTQNIFSQCRNKLPYRKKHTAWQGKKGLGLYSPVSIQLFWKDWLWTCCLPRSLYLIRPQAV